jgi:curved DNA-binding protein CbpA
MRTLYDVLDVRPDVDAENLRTAYRKAAKASHPDHHGGDPGAAARFRRIVKAYDILRDPERRTAYDALLEARRNPPPSKSKRGASSLMRHLVSEAIVIVGVAIVLASGYALFAVVSQTPAGEAAGIATREPARSAADGKLRDGRVRVAVPQMPLAIPVVAHAVTSDANDGDAPEAAKAEPAPHPDGLGAAGSDVAGLDQDKAPSADAQFSSPEKPDSAPRSPLSYFAMSDDQLDSGTSEPANANTGHVKLPEIKVYGRPPPATKRQAAGRPPAQQAALENRNTSAPCAGSHPCSGEVPILFGVGF